MFKTILIVIAAVLAIFGLSELLHGLWLIIAAPKRALKTFVVIWLDNDYAEQQMHFACEQARWLGRNYAENIVAVSSDLSAENYRTCKYLAEKNDIVFCPADALENVVACLSRG